MLRMDFLRFRKLGHRILVLTGICIALVLATVGSIRSSHEARSLQSASDRDVRRLMESVVRGVESVMLPGQASLAQFFAERLRTVPDVVDFRILRTDGNEAFRDNATLRAVNLRLASEHFALRPHERVVPVLAADDSGLRRSMARDTQVLDPVERIESVHGRTLTFVYAIPNRDACHGCHGKESAHLGALKLTVSMAASDELTRAATRSGWIATFVAIVIALALAAAVIRRTLVRPVEAVTAAMQRVSAGNLRQQVPVPGDDEIGQMASSFNTMIDRLDTAYHALSQERDKLTTVIASTGDGVVLTDSRGQVVFVNDAAVKLLGKRRERIMQEGFLRLFDDSAVMDTLLQRQDGQTPSPFKVGYKGRSLRVIAAAIDAADGTPTGCAALLRDITPSNEDAASP